MKPVGKMYKIYLSILIVWICYAFVCMKMIERERERESLPAVIGTCSGLVCCYISNIRSCFEVFLQQRQEHWGEGEPGKGVSIQSADLHDILLVSENKFLIYVYSKFDSSYN